MRRLSQVIAECLEPNPPQFVDLDWRRRLQLNLAALCRFCRSVAALRIVLWLVAWQLGAFTLSWVFDFGLRAQTWLVWSAALWVWPCLLRLRRRELQQLLAQRDSASRPDGR
jgi:hypothetical protein